MLDLPVIVKMSTSHVSLITYTSCAMIQCYQFWTLKRWSSTVMSWHRVIFSVYKVVAEFIKHFQSVVQNWCPSLAINAESFQSQSYGKTEKHHNSWIIDFSDVVQWTKIYSFSMQNRYPWWSGPASTLFDGLFLKSVIRYELEFFK